MKQDKQQCFSLMKKQKSRFKFFTRNSDSTVNALYDLAKACFTICLDLIQYLYKMTQCNSLNITFSKSQFNELKC